MMSWNVILFSVYQVIVILAIIHVIMDNRQPAKTMAWALVIWFVPVVGLVFYLFFGLNTRKEKFISQRSMDQLSKRSMLEFVEQKNLQLPAEHRQLIKGQAPLGRELLHPRHGFNHAGRSFPAPQACSTRPKIRKGL